MFWGAASDWCSNRYNLMWLCYIWVEQQAKEQEGSIYRVIPNNKFIKNNNKNNAINKNNISTDRLHFGRGRWYEKALTLYLFRLHLRQIPFATHSTRWGLCTAVKRVFRNDLRGQFICSPINLSISGRGIFLLPNYLGHFYFRNQTGICLFFLYIYHLA